jgi:hypothetical protein
MLAGIRSGTVGDDEHSNLGWTPEIPGPLWGGVFLFGRVTTHVLALASVAALQRIGR